MKYYILILLFFVSTLSQTSIAQNFVERHGYLSVKGTSLVDQHGNELTLKGVSLGWHNWWPRFYNKTTVEWLKSEWNCNVIRAAIGVEPQNAYLDNPDQAFKCLDNVVKAAIEKGLYVIIDWHCHSLKTIEAKEFFIKVATKYKDYPNIIYEIFNEPEGDTWEDVKSYSEEIINAIRSIDANNIILVGTPHWAQDVHLAADNPIQGYQNIMYTLHFYAGTHKLFLRNRADYALKKGLPIFVSECAAMDATGDGDIDNKEWNIWVDWMKANKISWIAWCISDKNETCAMVKDHRVSISEWENKDLKVWGRIVKDVLKE